jgi:glycerol transport system substrate-binding protein
MNFSEAGPVPAQGNIAQQVFWYAAFTADMTELRSAGAVTGLSG